ncbi:MAG: hypothetical protein ACYC3F_05285 [Gemmatimonadaceae bacterium]
MATDQWELIAEDVPAVEGIDLQGRHLHILKCPQEHFVILNSPTLAFDPKAIGGTLPCVRCGRHWLAPVVQE